MALKMAFPERERGNGYDHPHAEESHVHGKRGKGGGREPERQIPLVDCISFDRRGEEVKKMKEKLLCDEGHFVPPS